VNNDLLAGDFNDERLKYLYMSAKLGTMRGAADALGVAPSSVSRQIAHLERFLGLPLVEKGSHKVRLTEAGQHVVEHYRERLSQKEALFARLSDLKGVRAGHYSLAVGEGFISTVLLSTLQTFLRDAPGVRLDIVTAPTPEVISMVCEDLAHVGFVFDSPPDPRVRVKFTIPQPLRAVVSPTHPLAKRASLTVRELAEYPLILPRDTFRIREVLAHAEREAGVALQPVVRTNSLLMMRECVRSGVGITIMSELSIVDELDAGRLRAVPIDDPMLLSTKAEVVVRLGRQLPSGVLTILDILSRVMNRWRKSHRA
jgi:DNA-binding transcriptional LysR family regulator